MRVEHDYKSLFKCAAITFMLVTSNGHAAAQEYLCRELGSSWVWFGDHIISSISYKIVGPPDRVYETATGVSIGGTPLGWRSKHSGINILSAWGMGAIHIRQADNGSKFKVCVSMKDIDPVTIISREF